MSDEEERLVTPQWPSDFPAKKFRAAIDAALALLAKDKVRARQPHKLSNEYVDTLRWRFYKGNDLVLEWRDDGFIDVRYFVLKSYGSTQKWTALKILREHLPIASPDVLHALYEREPKPRTLAAFLLSNPSEPSARAVKVAKEALKSDSDDLKQCVGYVACYLNWPALDAPLRQALKKQPPGDTKAWLEKGLLGGGIEGGLGIFS
jgi:hypothetical protein